MTMMPGTNRNGWCEGVVATFAKLHYDTFACGKTIGPPRHALSEKVKQFSVEGKYRPCLILAVRDDHFRIWCATTHPDERRRYIPLRGVPRLRGESFLELDPR